MACTGNDKCSVALVWNAWWGGDKTREMKLQRDMGLRKCFFSLYSIQLRKELKERNCKGI